MIASHPGMTDFFTLLTWWSSVTQTWPITLLFIHDDRKSPRYDRFLYSSYMMIVSYPDLAHYFTLHSLGSSVTQVWPITLLFIHDYPQSPRYDPLLYSSFMMILSYPGVTHYFTLHSWLSLFTKVWPTTLLLSNPGVNFYITLHSWWFKCMTKIYRAIIVAKNTQHMKTVQNCTGFMLCSFSEVVYLLDFATG